MSQKMGLVEKQHPKKAFVVSKDVGDVIGPFLTWHFSIECVAKSTISVILMLGRQIAPEHLSLIRSLYNYTKGGAPHCSTIDFLHMPTHVFVVLACNVFFSDPI